MQQNIENEKKGIANVQNEINGENKQEKSPWLKMFDGRLVALFVLGILIGVTVKTQALRTVTMGFDDYRLKETKHDFNLTQKQAQENKPEEETADPEQEEIEIEE